MSYSNWMKDNANIHSKKLRYICLPATHDSGTYALTDVLCPTDQKTFAFIEKEVGYLVEELTKLGLPPQYDPAALLLDEAIGAVKGLATANESTIRQQLDDGIRGFDLRIALDASDDTYKIYHGLFGPALSDVYAQIAAFLQASPGEIVYLNLSHFSPPATETELERFCSEILGALGRWIYVPVISGGQITNDVFDQTYDQIVGSTGSKVILVCPDAAAVNTSFWPVGYCPPVDTRYDDEYESDWADYPLQGVYKNTEDVDDMLAAQLGHFENALAIDQAFALYTTLTPSGASYTAIIVTSLGDAVITLGEEVALADPILGAAVIALGETFKLSHDLREHFTFTTLQQLSQRIDRQLEYLVTENFVPLMPEGNRISMLFCDFYETTEAVELAISLSNDFAPEWTSDTSIPAPTGGSEPKTDEGPAGAMYQGDLYVVYKSNDEDRVWVTVNRGGEWTENYRISASSGGIVYELDTDKGPAIAEFGGLLYVAYRHGSNDGLYYSTFDGASWSVPTAVTITDADTKTDNSPYLTVSGGRLHLAFKGDGNDDIAVAILGSVGGDWYDGQPIAKIGDDDVETNKRPAIASFKDAFYLLYKDDGSNDINQAINNGTWSGGGPIQDLDDDAIHPKTKEGPGLCVFAGDLFMVYRGESDHIYVAVQSEAWGGNERIADISEANLDPKSDRSPFAVHTGHQLWVLYKRGDEKIGVITYEAVSF